MQVHRTPRKISIGSASPNYLVGQAVSTAVSPDCKTLLVLTTGYNDDSDPATKSEFVFVFDISSGTPVQKQALPVPNAFCGVAWAPNGMSFYVAGGQDDNVHVFAKTGEAWAESGSPIALKHTAFGVTSIPAGNGLFSLPGFGAAVAPLAAGLAVTDNGVRVVIANLENDSISIVNTQTKGVHELDLRPGRSNAAQSLLYHLPLRSFPVRGDIERGIGGRLRVATQYMVRSLLADHDCGRIQIASSQRRHDR